MNSDTICALATASGMAAQGIIKVSGPEALHIVSKIFFPVRKEVDLTEAKGYTALYGWIISPSIGERVDDAIALVLRAPHSYTGEDQVELSCHGSPLILQLVLQLLIDNGARMAEAGEFTRRAFSNGKMDLSQAEAVADVIASTNKAALRMSLTQMRGGFRKRIETLRSELIQFASLIELELDFSEEDVEFVNRDELYERCSSIINEVQALHNSYQTGQVIKNGIPIAIAGSTNAGKSTLLNTLLQEERAIVSDIHGTTRDYIEDSIFIQGKQFRITDTAGLRVTEDTIEELGIQRSFQKVSEAQLTLWIIDTPNVSSPDLVLLLNELLKHTKLDKIQPVLNKVELSNSTHLKELEQTLSDIGLEKPIHLIAKDKESVVQLTHFLSGHFQTIDVSENQVLVSNLRQANALAEALLSLSNVSKGILDNISGDLIAQDLRVSVQSLGEVIGTVTTDDLLQNIFQHFCIGK